MKYQCIYLYFFICKILHIEMDENLYKISKLQTYISILTLIEIVYHVYILFSEYVLHWFSRVLFIQREIMFLTELIKVENVNKYLFPKLKKMKYQCCYAAKMLIYY
jgi:hypothetical protein